MRHFPIQFSEPSFSPVGQLCAVGRRDGECAVDPDLRRELRGLRRATHEAVGAGGVGRGQHVLPVLDHLGGAAEVDLPGREQADAAVAVFSIVPLEEGTAEGNRDDLRAWARAAIEDIDAMRSEFVDSQNAREMALLIKIDDAFARTINANANAHLKSLLKVEEMQDRVL